MDVTSTPDSTREERQTRLALIGGIALWFLHQNLIYGLASVSCVWGWFTFTVAGMPGLQFVETVISIVAIPLMALMIFWPWRHWRKFQTRRPTSNPHVLHDTEQDRRPLLGFIVMLMNSLFLLFILASFVPIFALNGCHPG